MRQINTTLNFTENLQGPKLSVGLHHRKQLQKKLCVVTEKIFWRASFVTKLLLMVAFNVYFFTWSAFYGKFTTTTCSLVITLYCNVERFNGMFSPPYVHPARVIKQKIMTDFINGFIYSVWFMVTKCIFTFKRQNDQRRQNRTP